MFFKCKVCGAKDQQIKDLQDQVAFLRKMVMPSASPDAHSLEMNKILDGSALPVIDVTNRDPADVAADSEAIRILTGNYFEQ